MRSFFLGAALVCAVLMLACENTIQRPASDALITDTDTIAAGDTDVVGTTDDGGTTDKDAPVVTDNVTPTDNDGAVTDEAIPDETTEEEPTDTDEESPDEDGAVGNACAENGGACVSDRACPANYTPSEQFMCDAGLCCMPTGVSGLRVDVTGPQPVPGALLAIPATMPQPSSGGTGTPAITADIAAPLLAIGLVEENVDGCNAYQTGATGFIVIVQRGNCTFSQKIQNAADAGAIAVIIYNNTAGALGMNADGTLPTVGITQEAGQAILGFTGDHPDITAAIRP